MMLLLFPILWSIVAAGSILWYQRTENDIFWVLAVASAIIGLIWVLVIAHWSIQLLGSILLLKARSPIARFVQIKVNK